MLTGTKALALIAQDLLSRAKQQLSANMELLQHLQARAGLPQTAVGDGSAYGLFMTGAK